LRIRRFVSHAASACRRALRARSTVTADAGGVGVTVGEALGDGDELGSPAAWAPAVRSTPMRRMIAAIAAMMRMVRTVERRIGRPLGHVDLLTS
jgi:hypothetical protein